MYVNAYVVFVIFFAFLIITSFLLRFAFFVIIVEGTSMLPTLQCGDRILVLRWWPRKWLQKNQIICILSPRTSPLRGTVTEYLLIKRIVAVAGETFKPLGRSNSDMQNWYIPSKHLFVCGDNQENSDDSRKWGPIPLHSVKGIVIMKLPYRGKADFQHLYSSGDWFHKQGPIIGHVAPYFYASSVSDEIFTLERLKEKKAVFVFIRPNNICNDLILECNGLYKFALQENCNIILMLMDNSNDRWREIIPTASRRFTEQKLTLPGERC